MPELLLKTEIHSNDCSWIAHRIRPGNWATRAYTCRVAIEEWYLQSNKPRQKTLDDEISSEEINNLLGEVQKLSNHISQVAKNLDAALLQMKANQKAIDQGKAEIFQIKKELSLA